MMPAEVLGLWQSSFGAVKMEPDTSNGQEHIMGVWLYERSGQDIIGYFEGALRGNVLEFTWHEPAQPQDLLGGGYLVFEPGEGRFSGTWWTGDRTRQGAWNGWRPTAVAPAGASHRSGDGPAPGPVDAAAPAEPADAPPLQDEQDPGASDRLSW